MNILSLIIAIQWHESLPPISLQKRSISILRHGSLPMTVPSVTVSMAIQSLGQVLIQVAEASSPGGPLVMPGLSVQDKPHFSYRGAHFDPCRHFFTVDELKKFIDIMALHKLNTLHWHLTDDQGWRLEIKEYPLLTEVGAVRKETKVGHYNDVAAGYDGIPYGEGCWYSRQDVREIVEYAADRQITVIL